MAQGAAQAASKAGSQAARQAVTRFAARAGTEGRTADPRLAAPAEGTAVTGP